MTSNSNKDNLDYMYKAILQLKTIDECYRFFSDLCTPQELKSISQRLFVAKLLTEKHVYNEIVEDTGASTATISRVKRTLDYGNDGYRAVFERLAAEEDESGDNTKE